MKAVSILFFLLASFVFSSLLIGGERERLHVLRALIRFLSVLEEKIGTLSVPVTDVYAAYEDRALSPLLSALREGRAGVFLAEGKEYPPPVSDALTHCLVGLGNGFSAEERKKCRDARERITAFLEKAEAELPSRVRVTRTLCATFGATVAILLL